MTLAHRRAVGWSPAETAAVASALEPLLHGVVAAFVPLAHEPGLPPRPDWLLPVLLPSRALDWERSGELLGERGIGLADVVLVPAVLVSRSGVRLGRGGGSYDRALLHARGLTVAVVRDEELVDDLPADEWDVPVAAVCTPSLGVVRLGLAGGGHAPSPGSQHR